VPIDSLEYHTAHLWFCFIDQALSDPIRAKRYPTVLDRTERERWERFQVEHARNEFLVGHVLVRTILSRYASVTPHDWRFEINEHGRPSIARGLCDLDVRFNLSHTRGLTACLIALGADVGVDVEWADRTGGGPDLADRFFSAPEVRSLRALPAEQQRDRFFQYWTLKESYIKARGMGLAIPLARFGFERLDEKHPLLWVDPTLGDRADRWRFEQFRPAPSYHAAVAVERREGRDPSILVRTAVPSLNRDSEQTIE
jgi:4'-phosphopantetheinyl transferase